MGRGKEPDVVTATTCPDCGAPLATPGDPYCRVCGEVLDGGRTTVDDDLGGTT